MNLKQKKDKNMKAFWNQGQERIGEEEEEREKNAHWSFVSFGF